MSTVEKKNQYRGDLSQTALPEILYTIFRHRVPGVMEAIHEDTVKRIYIKDGFVVRASSSDIEDSLGCYLLNKGMISREDFKTTMRARRNSEGRYGELVVESGLLSPAQLYHAIRLQTEDIVWSLFPWEQGQVTFNIGDWQDPFPVSIQIPMRQVIKEGVRRIPSARGLLARVGKKDTVLEPHYKTDDLIEVALSSDEYNFLKLVDGKKTLIQLCSEGPLSTAENGKLLYAMYVLQFVRRCEPLDPTSSIKIRLKTEGDRYRV